MSWNDGYVSELDYICGYTRELNPLMLKLALLTNGYRPPHNRPLRYLELGIGQGLSINAHAAASPDEFWGNDFNPSHSVNAHIMAQASGANVTILDDSFAELAARKDLPEFDIIVLHGVWVYVSAENQQFILDIIRSKLALGGMVYISYNTTPGWSAAVPIQHLMKLHANVAASMGENLITKMDGSLRFIQNLIDADIGYFNATPSAVHHFDRMKNNHTAYLIHEYFNGNWTPVSFANMAKQLTNLHLHFVGSAEVTSVFTDDALPNKIKAFLADIKNPLFHESVRDFCIHQIFRKDIWVKGGIKITPLQRLQLLSDIRFTLLFNPLDEPLMMFSNIGSLPIDENIARPLLALLAKNNAEPKSISTLFEYPELKPFALNQVCNVVLQLCGRYVAPTHDDNTIAELKPRTDKLNYYLMSQDPASEHSEFLVSPVIGGGVSVPHVHQLFLLAIKSGFDKPETAVKFVWQLMSSKGHRMKTPDGRLFNGSRENIAELTFRAKPFFETHLSTLKALKIA